MQSLHYSRVICSSKAINGLASNTSINNLVSLMKDKLLYPRVWIWFPKTGKHPHRLLGPIQGWSKDAANFSINKTGDNFWLNATPVKPKKSLRCWMIQSYKWWGPNGALFLCETLQNTIITFLDIVRTLPDWGWTGRCGHCQDWETSSRRKSGIDGKRRVAKERRLPSTFWINECSNWQYKYCTRSEKLTVATKVFISRDICVDDNLLVFNVTREMKVCWRYMRVAMWYRNEYHWCDGNTIKRIWITYARNCAQWRELTTCDYYSERGASTWQTSCILVACSPI